MRIKWSIVMAAIGAALMMALILVFYASTDKTSIRQWVNTFGFLGIWLGARFLQGAPFTRTVDVLFNLYLVAFSALEGFFLGSLMDFVGKKLRRMKF